MLVINRYKPDMVSRGDMLSIDDIVDILHIDVIGIIPEDEKILSDQSRSTLVMQNGHAKETGVAIRNIAGRVEGDEIPFIDLS